MPSKTTIQKQFIGWDQPALPFICKTLIEENTTESIHGKELDLGNHIVVLPSTRAKFRALELLVQFCEQQSLVFTPPDFITLGQLPEKLYRQKKVLANQVTRKMAWVHAIRSLQPSRLKVIFPNLPDDRLRKQVDYRSWLEFAEMIERLHNELAGNVLDFEAIRCAGAETINLAEKERWEILAEIQQTYLSLLDKNDLWDKQTARNTAIQLDECQTDKQIVLVGTVDMTESIRQMLTKVNKNVKSFIFAPETLRDRFDEFGCLINDQWKNAEIEITREQLIVADRPTDQANAVAHFIDQLKQEYRNDQISVAVPDSAFEPFLTRKLARHELPIRFARGVSVAASPLFKLLQCIATYLDRDRFEEFSELVRHPMVYPTVSAEVRVPDLLSFVDAFQNSRLPTRVSKVRFKEDDDSHQVAKEALATVNRLIAPLRGKSRPIGLWKDNFFKMLENVFAQVALDSENPNDVPTLQLLKGIRDLFAEFTATPLELQPVVKGDFAIRLMMRRLASELIPNAPDSSAIDAIGWLDMLLDDAEISIVTGFNDGIIPSAETSDLFLPNSVRETLGLLDNNGRYARDAYAISAILNSSTKTLLVTGRHDSDGNPLSPSRLMFATDSQTIAERSLGFFSHHGNFEEVPESEQATGSKANSEDATPFDESVPSFYVPTPLDGPFEIPKITSLSPTRFRQYLACPYRFFLSYMKLRAVDDRQQELDAPYFGNLLHNIVEDFGESELKDSTDVREIRDYFRKKIHALQHGLFTDDVKPAVRLQIENLKIRLDRFAYLQAKRRQEGWRIAFTEKSDLTYEMMVDDEPFTITGRIDRIDQHDDGSVMIFDYKSSDKRSTPEKAHFKQGKWVDLQLPLYRHLVKEMNFTEPVKLGYISIPQTLDEIGFYVADWSEEDFKSADEATMDAIRGIRNGVFWPPADPAPIFDDFKTICMEEVIDKPKKRELIAGGAK